MTPEQAARRWRERRTAQSRRDVELETFPNTAGAQSKVSHPMFGTGRPASPARARLPGLVTQPPAPAGMTSYGTWSPASIEHVGGGYHLLTCNLLSQDEEWMTTGGDYGRWSIAIWLIRPDSTISAPWLSPGNIVRPITQGPLVPFGIDAVNASPYGEPIEESTPKLTRWQEGALLSFTILTNERQYVEDTAGFWPQYTDSELDVPYGATVYRWVGHDGTDPVVGPPLELYSGGDDDFPIKGDWDTGSGTEHDDGTTRGFEVVSPSADTNIALYGLADNSSRHRIWLFDKAADGTVTLNQRTNVGSVVAGSEPRLANPGGFTRIAANRWVALTSLSTAATPGMLAALVDAKTGTVIDTVQWHLDDGFADCYYIDAFWVYHAGNHLHFDGQATFAAWWKSPDYVTYDHFHTTLTADGDTLTVGELVQWDSSDVFTAERFVETCEGCLRIVTTRTWRQQALFERRQVKAPFSPLPSPESAPSDGVYADQRTVPTSHPAGSMWAANVALGDTWDGFEPIIPKLVRYPA